MPKLTCFLCPTKDFSEFELTDRCPKCGRTYGFPLELVPSKIIDYTIQRPLGRGHYGATFLAKHGSLQTECVLKISPKNSYAFFEKEFDRECKLHLKVAEQTEHVVPIRNMFDTLIEFGDISIDCHVAQLDFVDGDPLEDYYKNPLRARTAAQIAIDLFVILDELRTKEVFHNDLHGRNLIVQRISKGYRPDALDGKIRVVAVDMGSIEDRSKSDTARFGDIRWVAQHISCAAEQLTRDPDRTTDLDYRLVSVLVEIAARLTTLVTSQRLAASDDYRRMIKDAFQQVSSPWCNPLKLSNFHDSYNAQTLDAWYVPHLLVDPNGNWLNRMSTPGPQVITGMRGCGKTMLLRALQFHARATPLDKETPQDIAKRLADDRFLGLYASSTRLLETLGMPHEQPRDPYARLYVAYAIEAIRAVRHLREIDAQLINPDFVAAIAGAVSNFLKGADGLREVRTDAELERKLLEIDVRLRTSDRSLSLAGHPSSAFPHLAEAIRNSAEIWNNSCVLFLVDDVSTRYLSIERVEELFSSILFQSPSCAFKLTSEAQTIELALRSPGQIERARAGRDYVVFDLGAEVYDRITRQRGRDKVSGKDFVGAILQQRANKYANHPKLTPAQILSDFPLEQIAMRIAEPVKGRKGTQKRAYFGMTALARVCVGDIGDVISLYDSILKQGEGRLVPISPAIQSDCYHDFCSRKLYDLSRRGSWLKNVALSFAEASHELLIKSYADLSSGVNQRNRLRQYSQLYIRITGGEVEKQYERIRELIDAGVFVFAGGIEAPRIKSPSAAPVQQFKLTFRKVYGLSNLIGLAESDRFELTSTELQEWLDDPKDGKRVLMTNLARWKEVPTADEEEESSSEVIANLAAEGTDKGGEREDGDESDLFLSTKPKVISKNLLPLAKTRAKQGNLFSTFLPRVERKSQDYVPTLFERTALPTVELISPKLLVDANITQGVFGLGFEDRAYTSLIRVLDSTRLKHAVLIGYPDAGQSARMMQALRQRDIKYTVIPIETVIGDYSSTLASLDLPSNLLVDVSGLSKAAIFRWIRGALRRTGQVWICRTEATAYFPRETEVEVAIKADVHGDHNRLIDSLDAVSTGENGPYHFGNLLSSDFDQSRRRAVCCFSSAKYQRLLQFLDERSFDSIEIATPNSKTNRSALAMIAAEIAAKNFSGTSVTEIDLNNVSTVLDFIFARFQQWYVSGGFNFELAMTGSKPESIACAIASSVLKVSQCWWVGPTKFDSSSYSIGTAGTRFFHAQIPQRYHSGESPGD